MLRAVRLRGADPAVDASGEARGRRRACGTGPRPRCAEALARAGHAYTMQPGDGAFYGPKIDFVVRDALRREHQLGTIQLDYVLPERFDLRLHRRRRPRAAPGDDPPRDARLARAVPRDPDRALRAGPSRSGSPPSRCACLSITDRAAEYGRATSRRGWLRTGCGSRRDVRNEKIGAKIREAQLAQVPLMLVVGDREAADGHGRGARAPRRRSGSAAARGVLRRAPARGSQNEDQRGLRRRERCRR